jgi:hypothetical protein
MTMGTTPMPAAPACRECGTLLEVRDAGALRCRRCRSSSRPGAIGPELPQRACAMGHPGCEVATSDDLAV